MGIDELVRALDESVRLREPVALMVHAQQHVTGSHGGTFLHLELETDPEVDHVAELLAAPAKLADRRPERAQVTPREQDRKSVV